MDTVRDLSTRLAALLRNEQRAMADFLVALSDFDRSRAWAELGHASLFSYLRRDLGLSAGAAQYRKTAAELIQKFPEVEAALRCGKLCLSTVAELAKVLTDGNVDEVLPRFAGLSRKEAEALAASIRPVPKPPIRDVVTPGRAAPVTAGTGDALRPGGVGQPEVRPGELNLTETAASPSPTEAARPSVAPPARDSSKPLDAGTARLHVTVSRRFLAKLEAARDALSHAKPGATTEEILESALDLLLAERAKRRHALVAKPRVPAPAPPANDVVAAPGSIASPAPANAAACRTIPAHVRREVWKRAGGRCEWKLDSGECCGSTVRLEYDHVVPHARGGPGTIDNVRLLCAAHNQLAARQVFGDAWMARYCGSARDHASR